MLGVCYYPEHWPSSCWADDARKMRALGLEWVRIAEFSWSRLEPESGRLEFDWLDTAIATLGAAGLRVVLGTPTATPPKWLIDQYPEILPVDPATGQVRGFGSRRHYDFSSQVYLREALRISELMARRYGNNPHVGGWQTDNELSCHDTTLSASRAARDAFRAWCRERYQDIDVLNRAWGNVFWSMEYQDFDAIELPVLAVTETSPAHRLAYRRFSSDQVIRFNEEMCRVIRQHSTNQFVTHNFIPPEQTGVDNTRLAATLDFASYDNYPLGHTDILLSTANTETLQRYQRTGLPDVAALRYDQIRGFSNKPFWVMEQQPGPVNWAPNNPRPAPGMVRVWTLEAFAHGADCVSYFRWRQAPFAQEQMHAGLLRPDSSEAPVCAEIRQALRDVSATGLTRQAMATADVAILISDEARWIDAIERQGSAYRHEDILWQYYGALRQLGLNVDIISPTAVLDDYRLLVVPALPLLSAELLAKLQACTATVVFGPRAGAKTEDFCIPQTLAPGRLQSLIDIRVLSVETLRADCHEPLHWQGSSYASTTWREEIASGAAVETLAFFADNTPAVVRQDRIIYLASLTCDAFLRDFLSNLCTELDLETLELPTDLRMRRRGNLNCVFNYANTIQTVPAPDDAEFILGKRQLPPGDIAIWRKQQEPTA
ncbi:MAG: beta-galactosidase [Pseudomonadales bacterium]|nr:beta-galactosidase [Pseudomonadales bacterium]